LSRGFRLTARAVDTGQPEAKNRVLQASGITEHDRQLLAYGRNTAHLRCEDQVVSLTQEGGMCVTRLACVQ